MKPPIDPGTTLRDAVVPSVALSNVTVQDALSGNGVPVTATVRRLGVNVLGWQTDGRSTRFVRCQGDPSAIYGD